MELLIKVDLARIRRNVAAVRAATGGRVLLMVKADAYGHGMKRVARALESDADMLGVAVLEEGRALRESGVTAPVLVAAADASEYAEAADLGLTVAVCDESGLDALAAMRRPPAFHLKFDTGMHRLGFPAEDAAKVCARAARLGLVPEGCYSHFGAPSKSQLARFGRVAAASRKTFPRALLHIASSGTLDFPGALYDMVRVGHAAYAGAMRVESRVIASRRAKAGDTVGYGLMPLAHDTCIAVVLGGYADGVRRARTAAVIGGVRYPSLGSVCMDMFAVDTGDRCVCPGETAVLLGEELTARELADMQGTVDYDILTGFGGRAKRIYTDDQR